MLIHNINFEYNIHFNIWHHYYLLRSTVAEQWELKVLYIYCFSDQKLLRRKYTKIGAINMIDNRIKTIEIYQYFNVACERKYRQQMQWRVWYTHTHNLSIFPRYLFFISHKFAPKC